MLLHQPTVGIDGVLYQIGSTLDTLCGGVEHAGDLLHGLLLNDAS